MTDLQQRLREKEDEFDLLAHDASLSDEQNSLLQLARVQARIKDLTEWADDLKGQLMDHYRETGEKPHIANGPALEVRSRTTYKYDDAALQEHEPDLFRKLAKIDGARVTALLKAGALRESDIEAYRLSETVEFVQVSRAK
ncbi:hypothetical protein BH11ARM2_BH11ARM2_16000 [soil metagenome]